MENKKYIIIGMLLAVCLGLGVGLAYFFPKQNTNEEKVVETVENTENMPVPAQETQKPQSARKYGIEELLISTGEGSVHLGGYVEEVKENEIILNLAPEGSEKLLRTLKIDENTELYTFEGAREEEMQRVTLNLSDFKEGDFLNVLIKEEDDIQSKDVFQALDICLTKIIVSGL